MGRNVEGRKPLSFVKNYATSPGVVSGASGGLERLRRELDAKLAAELAAVRAEAASRAEAEAEAELARLRSELDAERRRREEEEAERLRREYDALLASAREEEARKARERTAAKYAAERERLLRELATTTRDAEPQAGTRQVWRIKGVDFAFRYCPAGTFLMGSPEDEAERDDDETRHEVTLTKGFWMLETPVTQGMYRAITGWNPSDFKSGNNYPVENVSWFDSQEFCKSLNALGVAPAGFAFRLPTEAEWEYACRAGTNTPYFWGSTLNGDKANCDGNYPYGGVSAGRYKGKPSAVGSYAPNGWGLYNMHGNVWEWCADWYGAYGSGSQTDPTGPSGSSVRVLRGGSWNYFAGNCRSACRSSDGPTYRFNYYGFRLVLGR